MFVFIACGIWLVGLGLYFVFLRPPLLPEDLSALISKRGGERDAGASLGIQNAANSIGQAGGPLLGGGLFLWQTNAPYLFSGVVLLTVALLVGWKAMGAQSEAELARQ